ncbi:MAG: hypothetical protein F6K41_32200 [Symploca sp. SIO3E6]|nr:hypothetical protein [Caldora sp. SIO3E6]
MQTAAIKLDGLPFLHSFVLAGQYLIFFLPPLKLNLLPLMLGSIARFDYQTNTLTEAEVGENRYVVEPIYAADTFNREQGWLLTVVYDGNAHRSEIWVFAEGSLEEEPVCRLGLPKVLPFSFHGTWKPVSPIDN